MTDGWQRLSDIFKLTDVTALCSMLDDGFFFGDRNKVEDIVRLLAGTLNSPLFPA